jgi:transcriptional regulator with XRE-family HTH domain
MPASDRYEVRDYGFADQALPLRKRAGLTQQELGALLGVSKRAIGAWESGVTYPGAEHLQQLIALYLARGALVAGREEEEARSLWEAVRRGAGRHLGPFDPRWFAALRGEGDVGGMAVAPSAVPDAGQAPRHDWGRCRP